MVPKLAALADANDAEFFDHLGPKDRAMLFSWDAARAVNAVSIRRIRGGRGSMSRLHGVRDSLGAF